MFRRLCHESLESRITPAVLLSDAFASTALEPAHWDLATGATVEPNAVSASSPAAVRLSGNAAGGDELRSVAFNVAGQSSATLSYRFARTGGLSRPTAGEDLVVEYKLDAAEWTELARHPGGEPDMTVMAERIVVVSLPTETANLRIRFRHTGARANLGDYLVDDVSLIAGPSEARGRLWFDRNASGQIDVGEPPLVGWQVFADENHNGMHDASEPLATTVADGSYVLSSLVPGAHAIRPLLATGWSVAGSARGDLAPRWSIDRSTIAELAGARAVVASADDRFLYIAGEEMGAIVVIERTPEGSLVTRQTLTSASADAGALARIQALTLSGDGFSLYSASGDADAIAWFSRDAASGLLTWRETIRGTDSGMSALDYPTSLVASPDGRHVYVAAANAAAILTFTRDAASGQLTFAAALPDTAPRGLGGATALAISPDGRHVYVAASGENAVTTLSRNTTTGELVFVESHFDGTSTAAGIAGASSVVVSPDGRQVVVAGGFDDALAIFDRNASTGRLTFRDLIVDGLPSSAPVSTDQLDGPQSLAFSLDGTKLYVAAINDDAVSVFARDATSGEYARRTVVADAAGAATLDGVRGLVVLSRGDVATVASGGGALAILAADRSQMTITVGDDAIITGVDFALHRAFADWSGAGGNPLWSTAANWYGNLVPLGGEAVRLAASGSVRLTTTNDLPVDITLGQLVLAGTGVDIAGAPLHWFASATDATPSIMASGGNHRIVADVSLPPIATIRIDSGSLEFGGAVVGQSTSMSGVGELHFRGTTTFVGAVAAQSLYLQVDGDLTAGAGVSLASGATLGGMGVVHASVVADATARIAPGGQLSDTTTPRTATLAMQDLRLAAGATLSIELDASGGATTFDRLVIPGGVDVTDATLAVSIAGVLPAGTSYTIVDNDGVDPIVGAFAGIGEGQVVELDGQRFLVTYRGGDGNDIAIVVPPTGSVRGRVWYDLDADGVHDVGEAFLAGIDVFADLNGNGRYDTNEPRATTDIAGEYLLAAVPVGRSRIAPASTVGWQVTTPLPMADFINSVETLVGVPLASAVGIKGLDGVRAAVVSPDGRNVYTAANNDDAVASFRRDAATGRLTQVGYVVDGANGTNGLNGARGIAASADGRNVYVAGYFDDALAVFNRDAATGELSFVEAMLDNALGVDGLDGATAVVVSPDDRHVYVAGYLDDAVAVFSRNASTGRLTYVGRVRDGVLGVNGLDGAHGLAISPDGKHVYVAGAIDNSVAAFRRDMATGQLTFVGVHVNGVGGVTTLAVARAVAVSSDGRFVFVASEADNAVTSFSRNTTTGALTFASSLKNGPSVAGLGGVTSLAASPDGLRLFAASATDDAIVALGVNKTTGSLTLLEKIDAVATPNLDGAAAVAMSPNGDHLYIAGQNRDAIVVLAQAQPSDVVTLSPAETISGIDHGLSNVAPTVVSVVVRSTQWSPQFAAFVGGEAGGVSLSGSAPVFTALAGLDEIRVQFSEPVTVGVDDLGVFGIRRTNYPVASIEYDAASFTATYRLLAPLENDKVLLHVDAGVVDAVGATLSAAVERRLDVLVGSSNVDSGSGSTGEPTVGAVDLARVLAAQFTAFGEPGYSTAADIDGNGVVNYVDAILIRNQLGAGLPSGNPVVRAPGVLTDFATVLASVFTRATDSGYRLAADTNRDGAVTFLDLIAARNQFDPFPTPSMPNFATVFAARFSAVGDARFTPMVDLDGDAHVGFVDLILARNANGGVGEPTAAHPAALAARARSRIEAKPRHAIDHDNLSVDTTEVRLSAIGRRRASHAT